MNVNLRVVAFLLSLAATVFAIILGFSVGSEDYLLPALVVVVFASIFLVSHPQLVAACAVATFFSGVTLPGLPGQMKLSDLFAAALLGIFLLQAAFQKSDKKVPLSRLEWIVIFFCAWIFFVGAFRGFGFLAFGEEKIGGFLYVRLLLAASLVITLPRLKIPPGKWRLTMIFFIILAPATLIADLLIIKGWDFSVVRLFVQTSTQVMDMADQAANGSDDSVARLWSGGFAASGLMIAFLALVPMRKFFRQGGVIWLPVFGGIILLSLLSGFRLMTISLLVIAGLVLYFQKGFTAPRSIALILASCVALAATYLCAHDLPLSMQRTVSWLPGIDVSGIASGDASETVEWRFRLWKEASRYIPDYWLVGKGFSYDKEEYIASLQSSDDLRWALVSGSYHNGWFSMILCTGIIGTIFCLIILIAPVLSHWKRQQQLPWRNPTFKQMHGVFLAALATTCFVFLFVYGDVHVTFPVIFFEWAVLETLSRMDMDEETGATLDSGEPSSFESVYQDA